MAYRAVLFDFFGTLTTAMKGLSPTAPAAQALGVEPVAFAAMLTATYLARARGEFGDLPTQLRRVAAMIGQRTSPAQGRAAARLRCLAVASVIRLRPEAVPALRALRRQGLRVGLVSDCTDEVPPAVARSRIDPLLDGRVFSCQVGACKPDHRLYHVAAQQLRVRPSECLYVGDGGAHELVGADQVGMTAVRLAAPDLVHHSAHIPAPRWTGLAVTSLAQVPGLFQTVAQAPRSVVAS